MNEGKRDLNAKYGNLATGSLYGKLGGVDDAMVVVLTRDEVVALYCSNRPCKCGHSECPLEPAYDSARKKLLDAGNAYNERLKNLRNQMHLPI